MNRAATLVWDSKLGKRVWVDKRYRGWRERRSHDWLAIWLSLIALCAAAWSVFGTDVLTDLARLVT